MEAPAKMKSTASTPTYKKIKARTARQLKAQGMVSGRRQRSQRNHAQRASLVTVLSADSYEFGKDCRSFGKKQQKQTRMLCCQRLMKQLTTVTLSVEEELDLHKMQVDHARRLERVQECFFDCLPVSSTQMPRSLCENPKRIGQLSVNNRGIELQVESCGITKKGTRNFMKTYGRRMQAKTRLASPAGAEEALDAFNYADFADPNPSDQKNHRVYVAAGASQMIAGNIYASRCGGQMMYLSSKARNRLQHALIGNTASSASLYDPVIREALP